jgi:di/tricarboxylate transporter
MKAVADAAAGRALALLPRIRPPIRWPLKAIGWVAAVGALLFIVSMHSPQSLPPAGQVMLGILAFAVLVWMTEAMDYAVSGIVIGALMVFLLAQVPDATQPLGPPMGTTAALNLALTGFSNSAVALVAAACFIAAAMSATGLDRRIALVVLSKVDAQTNHIVIGAMTVGFLLSFVVPSTTRAWPAWRRSCCSR